MEQTSIALADPPFYTIQGEGFSAGRPAIFLRIQGCTVGCDWCDTKYSWSTDKGTEYTFRSIQEYLQFVESQAIVVVTGGEPFEHVEEVGAMLNALTDSLREFEVETSGYIFNRRLAKAFDRITISPKILSSARVQSDKRIDIATVEAWKMFEERYDKPIYWKFPIKTNEDLEQSREAIQKWQLDKSKVYLMPVATTDVENIRIGKVLAEECKLLGCNLSLRQHVALWGPRRGV